MTNQVWLAVLQSLITIGAVVLLWSMHTRLVDRPVFKWWAWAWTSFALYLGLGALAVPLEAAWTLCAQERRRIGTGRAAPRVKRSAPTAQS